LITLADKLTILKKAEPWGALRCLMIEAKLDQAALEKKNRTSMVSSEVEAEG
jgi:hypothetical protein